MIFVISFTIFFGNPAIFISWASIVQLKDKIFKSYKHVKRY